jgi:hypothetical protein
MAVKLKQTDSGKINGEFSFDKQMERLIIHAGEKIIGDYIQTVIDANVRININDHEITQWCQKAKSMFPNMRAEEVAVAVEKKNGFLTLEKDFKKRINRAVVESCGGTYVTFE